MATTKSRIKTFENCAHEMDAMIKEYDNVLPDEYKHITDRLNITLAELNNISECLKQEGFPDPELVSVMDELCDEF